MMDGFNSLNIFVSIFVGFIVVPIIVPILVDHPYATQFTLT